MDEEIFLLATCYTEGCENAGIPIQVPDNGAPTMCGPCETMISDFAPTPEEPPAEGSGPVEPTEEGPADA